VIGINSNGPVTSGFFISDSGVTEGFTDKDGTFTAVNYPGSAFNQLLSQNSNGQAAGYYSLSASGVPDVPYVYDEASGLFEVFTIPNSTTAQATGINNAGDICGFFVDDKNLMHGWLLEGAVFTSLNAPKGNGTTAALGLNNKGQVVGSYVDTTGGTHGFLYTIASKTWVTLDDPNGVGNTIANGINDAGDVVGFYGPSACGTNDCSGFLAKP
jgi:probable HAF family extracellular repeat protein